MGGIGKLVASLVMRTTGFIRPLTGALRMLGKFAGGLLGLLNPFNSVGKAISAFTAGFTVMNQLMEAFKDAANFESINISLNRFVGSARNLKILNAQMEQLAFTTPMTFEEIADSARRLSAAGTPVQEITSRVRMLGEIAAGTGGDLKDLAWLFGQTRVEGRLMTRDLTQWLNRSVPLIQELSNVLGVSQTEVRQLAAQGVIGFGDVDQALKNLTTGAGRFAGILKDQADSIGGTWNRLFGIFQKFRAEIGEAILEAINFKELSNRAIEWIKFMRAAFQEIIKDWSGFQDLLKLQFKVTMHDIKDMIVNAIKAALNQGWEYLKQFTKDAAKAAKGLLIGDRGINLDDIEARLREAVDKKILEKNRVRLEAMQKDWLARIQARAKGLKELANLEFDPIQTGITAFKPQSLKDATERGPALAGALQRGSKEAYSAIVQAQQQGIEKQMLEVQKKQTSQLEELVTVGKMLLQYAGQAKLGNRTLESLLGF